MVKSLEISPIESHAQRAADYIRQYNNEIVDAKTQELIAIGHQQQMLQSENMQQVILKQQNPAQRNIRIEEPQEVRNGRNIGWVNKVRAENRGDNTINNVSQALMRRHDMRDSRWTDKHRSVHSRGRKSWGLIGHRQPEATLLGIPVKAHENRPVLGRHTADVQRHNLTQHNPAL